MKRTHCDYCGAAFGSAESNRSVRSARCEPCLKKYQAEWHAKNKERRREYFARPEVRAARQERRSKWWRDPERRIKMQARFAVAKAIERGRMVRNPCEVCGAAEAEAHHPDYSKPLEVIWLCRQHHDEEHARLRPAKGGEQ